MYEDFCEDILLFEWILTEGLLGAGMSKVQNNRHKGP